MRLHQLGYRQIGARTEGCNLIQRRREKKKNSIWVWETKSKVQLHIIHQIVEHFTHLCSIKNSTFQA